MKLRLPPPPTRPVPPPPNETPHRSSGSDVRRSSSSWISVDSRTFGQLQIQSRVCSLIGECDSSRQHKYVADNHSDGGSPRRQRTYSAHEVFDMHSDDDGGSGGGDGDGGGGFELPVSPPCTPGTGGDESSVSRDIPFSAVRMRDMSAFMNSIEQNPPKGDVCSMCEKNEQGRSFCERLAEFVSRFSTDCTYTSLIGSCRDPVSASRRSRNQRHVRSPSGSSNTAIKKLVQRLVEFNDHIRRSVFSAFEHLSAVDAQRLSDCVIESIVYPKVHSSLIDLFRQYHNSTDVKFAQKMQMLSHPCITPQHMGIRGFCGENAPPLNSNATNDANSAFCECFRDAIQCLRDVYLACTPRKKLCLIVKMFRDIACAYSEYMSDSVGTDLLLPLLSYVIVVSGVQYLPSELQFVQYLVDQSSMDHEVQYCLGTLIGMVEWLCEFTPEQLDKPVDATVNIAEHMEAPKSVKSRKPSRSSRRARRWREKHVQKLVYNLATSKQTDTFQHWRTSVREKMTLQWQRKK